MPFHARLLQSGKTATGIRVPPEVVAGLGSSSLSIGGVLFLLAEVVARGRVARPAGRDEKDGRVDA
jgi:hypothetical protein